MEAPSSSRRGGWLSADALWTGGLLALAFGLVIGQTWLIQNFGLVAFLFTPGWLLWLWGRAQKQSEWFYRRTSGGWAWLVNRDVQWDTQVVLYGVTNSDAARDLQRWLVKQYQPANVEVIASDDEHIVMTVPVGTFVFTRTSRSELASGFTDEGRAGSVLLVDVHNVGSGYRGAVALAKSHLKPFLNEAMRVAGPTSSTFVLKARYSGTNPHWGLYVRSLGHLPTTMIRFEVAVKETVGHSTRNITVTQDQLTVAADDAGEFIDLVQGHLAFV